jgi:hypothetical protein
MQASARAWRSGNSERVRRYAREYIRKRTAEDGHDYWSQYLQMKLSKGLAFIRAGYFPEIRKPFIGCTWRELKLYLEAQFSGGMAWENYGKAWTIDHIVARKAFDLTDEGERLRCFYYRNLRPMLRSMNTDSSSCSDRIECDPVPTEAAIRELDRPTPPCRGSIGRYEKKSALLATQHGRRNQATR